MEKVSSQEIIRRIRVENPWWEADESIGPTYRAMHPRPYLELFRPLVKKGAVRRAVVLMGPRRVGKTVMLLHTIQSLIDDGVKPQAICYLSVDHPIYNGLSLEKLLAFYGEASGVDLKSDPIYVLFDEIQYLREWEVHLKSFVDTYPNIKAIASGSAAAALRLKSLESGAGRFTDFLLPPLTFYEYVRLVGKSALVEQQGIEELSAATLSAEKLAELNDLFLEYVNYGGYPEVALSPQIQADPARFIKNDIVDKVLLRDLPSLYGIQDIQDLNSLFTMLAFNTGNEISLEQLASNSGVAKNTIKRYIEYLASAFLIRVVHRVDNNAKRFRRANFFKVYLTNPSMRTALFSPLTADDPALGSLVETTVWAQWFHGDYSLYYARWRDGEVDIVRLGENQKPQSAVEVKWSDRYAESPGELRGLLAFSKLHRLREIVVTTRTKTALVTQQGVPIRFMPVSLYCYFTGQMLIQGLILDAPLPQAKAIRN